MRTGFPREQDGRALSALGDLDALAKVEQETTSTRGTMSRSPIFHRTAIALTVFSLVAVACSDQTTTQPPQSPLAGLSLVTTNDTNATPSAPLTGSGYFRGTVMAPSQPGAGNDSLQTSPKIANVRVTIYARVAGTGSSVELGASAGSVLTGSDGVFQLPTLPAGDYVVTFVPPEGSSYNSSYAFGPLRSNSSDHPWWVTLTKK